MDENPYRAPQMKESAPAEARSRISKWDWVGIVGAVLTLGGMLSRELTGDESVIQRYSRIVWNVGGIVLMVWSCGALATTAKIRYSAKVLLIPCVVTACILGVIQLVESLM